MPGRWGGRKSPHVADVLPPRTSSRPLSEQRADKQKEQERFERQQGILQEFANPSTSTERKHELLKKHEKLLRREGMLRGSGPGQHHDPKTGQFR